MGEERQRWCRKAKGTEEEGVQRGISRCGDMDGG